jgi:hypothetical protein
MWSARSTSRRTPEPDPGVAVVQTLPVTAQPLDHGSLDRGHVRLLIESLIAAHLEGVRLARRMLLLQEIADAAEHLATRTIDLAAGNPADQYAVEAAMSSSAAASQANADEIEASAMWACHLERTDELVRRATALAAALAEDEGRRRLRPRRRP